MFPRPQRPMNTLNKPALTPATPSTSKGTTGYFLTETWMTGLGNIAGIHRVDAVDEGTIAVSGELDKKCVVAVKDLKGETLSVINMGSEQVRKNLLFSVTILITLEIQNLIKIQKQCGGRGGEEPSPIPVTVIGKRCV